MKEYQLQGVHIVWFHLQHSRKFHLLHSGNNWVRGCFGKDGEMGGGGEPGNSGGDEYIHHLVGGDTLKNVHMSKRIQLYRNKAALYTTIKDKV